MKDRDLKIELENTITGLDWQKASWINKHFIVDLQDKATVLLSSLVRFEDDETEIEEIENKVVEFINEVNPIIEKLQNKEV